MGFSRICVHLINIKYIKYKMESFKKQKQDHALEPSTICLCH